MKYVYYFLGFSFFFVSCKEENTSQSEDFSKKISRVDTNNAEDGKLLDFFNTTPEPITPKFQKLPTGSNKPEGWILNIMTTDLETGAVGVLDKLYPGIKSDDLYNTQRRGGVEDVPEMGDLVLKGEEWEQSIMWWNSETAGNWWDGFVRYAFLTGNEKAISQSKTIVENLLDSQDEDGYIGIYKPNLRYQHKGSNGELWSQTTAFRTLLAYYEFTKESKVLEAVEKAMAITMKNYGNSGKNPFKVKNEFGGVTHGLMLTDVCETLYRLTGKQDYQDYATYLYQSFSTYPINYAFSDFRYAFLKEKDSLFHGHAVHTYEHIRTLVNAYYNTGYPELKQALDNAMHKVDLSTLPSGEAYGNEWLLKRESNPDNTATEFCAVLELRNSYGSLIQKTGKVAYADRAEKITYNAILGFRNDSGTAIAYGKLNNCYIFDGKQYEGETEWDNNTFKYSPTHSEPAVCCLPNYSRNFGYFLDDMWLKSKDGLVAAMYGPSKLTTQVNGSDVKILQHTNYPLSDSINFKLTLEKPTAFTLQLRKPEWSSELSINVEDATIELKEGFYHITKIWQQTDSLSITFKNYIKQQKANNGEVFLQRGAIVFAYDIPHTEKTIKSYSLTKFKDYYCFPEEETFKGLGLTNASSFKFVSDEQSAKSWYDNKTYLVGQMKVDGKTQEEVKLVPMGKTVLRRVTFPKD